MAKLQNLAFEMFIQGYKVDYSEDYSKYDDLVAQIDDLGRSLLLSKRFCESHVDYVLTALISLAEHKNLNIEEILTGVLAKYRDK